MINGSETYDRQEAGGKERAMGGKWKAAVWIGFWAAVLTAVPAAAQPGWVRDQDGSYSYQMEDGSKAQGFLRLEGKWYYFDENGTMAASDRVLDGVLYRFHKEGDVRSAGRVQGSGGGTFPVAMFDGTVQELFDRMSGEKLSQYEDEHPDWEERKFSALPKEEAYASFIVSQDLNEAAAHRLEGIRKKGRTGGKIPGEGSIEDYLGTIGRRGRTCMELWLPRCETADEAYEKLEERMTERYEKKEDPKYLLWYYREVGIARSREGEQGFLVLLVR